MRVPGSLRLWLILALAVLVALLFWPSTQVLYEQWSDFVNITFTHGWLVLPVSVALVLRSRRANRGRAGSALAPRMLALSGAVVAWLICYRASIQDLHITIFPAIFWFAVTAAFGWNVGRLLAFPVAFFYFAVPSWAQLGNPLQDLTVIAMQGFLGLTGPHAVISGDTIHIPNGSFRIEEGCSGLHFMIVGLAVAALHGELRRDPWRTRLAELGLMAVLSLLANWVRVYVIIEAGYLTNMQHYLVRVSHYWFGWGVFALALVAFFWLTTWFTNETVSEPESEFRMPAVSASMRAQVAGFATVAFLLAAFPALSLLVRQQHPPAPLATTPLATARPPWSFVPPRAYSFWVPSYPGADQTDAVAAQDGAGRTVELFRARYRAQAQGAELVGSSSSLLGTYLRYRGEQPVTSAHGMFRETEVADPIGDRSLIWWRYEIGGRVFVVPLASQLWYGMNALVSNPLSAVVALRAECRADCAEARATLQAFLASASIE